jgi:hypothetical protein
MTIIIPIILIGFIAIFVFLFKKMKGNAGNIAQEYQLALEEFNNNESAIMSKYWDNENRFQLFKTTINNDSIIGITTCAIPDSSLAKLKAKFVRAIYQYQSI